MDTTVTPTNATTTALPPVLTRTLFQQWYWLIILAVLLVTAVAAITYFLCKRRQNGRVYALLNSGNGHKHHKEWLEAAQAFETAATLSSQQRGREHDAANNFAEAANCYRKLKQLEYTEKAVQCLETAARTYAEVGQFSIAARHLEEAGDLLASADGDEANSRAAAIRLYQRAADYWSSEDSPASAADSRSKAAHVMADIGMFRDAAKEFEDLGVSSQRHSLLAFGAKDHLLKSCLSQMCLDPSTCPELADDLARKCDSFADSDERSLVMKLAAACDAGDIGAFDSAVTEFERFNNLDDWCRRRLVFARASVSGVNLR